MHGAIESIGEPGAGVIDGLNEAGNFPSNNI